MLTLPPCRIPMLPSGPSDFFSTMWTRLLRRRFEQNARGLGLTRSQWQVLAHLVEREGIHQGVLADVLEVASACSRPNRLSKKNPAQTWSDWAGFLAGQC